VDGTDFDGSRSPEMTLYGMLLARKECRLTLERGGRRIEVTVDSERFLGVMTQGEPLEPVKR
jgi:hypothetical protein